MFYLIGSDIIGKKFCVYVHVFPNNKKYFGITSKRPNARWEGGTGYDKEHQPVMYNAIQKYGWNNVKHIILYEELTFDEACKKEQELIAEFKTNCRRYGNEYGYNITDGGEGALGHKGGEKVTKVNRERLLGKKGKDCPNSRPVICDGIEYESLTQFKEMNGNPKGNIQGWLNGKVGMPEYWYNKKLHYKDVGFEVVKKARFANRCRKPMADGIVFNTLAECADYLHLTPSVLCLYLTNQCTPPDELVDRNLKYEDEESHTFKAQGKNSRPIKCTIDGIVFDSCQELADYIGRTKGTVWCWLSGRNNTPEEYRLRNLKKVE